MLFDLCRRIRQLSIVAGAMCACVILSGLDAHALWPPDPTINVPLCTAAHDQYVPEAATDWAGGAIVVWMDFRNGTDWDIYAQRVDATGTALWAANGIPVCTVAGDQWFPQITPEPGGGAYVVWYDDRSLVT